MQCTEQVTAKENHFGILISFALAELCEAFFACGDLHTCHLVSNKVQSCVKQSANLIAKCCSSDQNVGNFDYSAAKT
jgi:hypothetical protein